MIAQSLFPPRRSKCPTFPASPARCHGLRQANWFSQRPSLCCSRPSAAIVQPGSKRAIAAAAGLVLAPSRLRRRLCPARPPAGAHGPATCRAAVAGDIGHPSSDDHAHAADRSHSAFPRTGIDCRIHAPRPRDQAALRAEGGLSLSGFSCGTIGSPVNRREPVPRARTLPPLHKYHRHSLPSRLTLVHAITSQSRNGIDRSPQEA